MNYPTTFPELSTERTILRQLSFKDKRAIFKLRSNKDINKLITRQIPKNLNDADAFIEGCLSEFENENCIFWAMQLQETQQIVGTIALNKINSKNSYAEIDYELSPDYQKEGLMTEAMKVVLEFGKNTLNLKTIDAFTHKNNNDSITLLEKHQFTLGDDDLFGDNCIFSLNINQE